MKRSFRLTPLLFVPVLLSNCGGGGYDSGVTPYNPMWVNIDTRYLGSTVAAGSVELHGSAYCGNMCPSGDVGFGYCPPINYSIPAPVMDIVWNNRNTGASGVAAHAISGSCSCLFSYCFTSYSHKWIVYGGVTLALGENSIEVTASDTAGYSANDAVSVTRSTLYNPQDIAVDTLNNELFAINSDPDYPGFNKIVAYGRTENGYAIPARIISGSATNLYSPYGIAVDNINNEIFVAKGGSVLVFPLAASGNQAPVRSIAGISAGLSANSIDLDIANNEIFAANSSGSITVHARTTDGDVPPLRTISGASTGLNNPYGVAVDTINDEVFVANYSANSVTVYSQTANGDVSPIRTISGAATGLSYPHGISVDTLNNELFVSNSSNSITVYALTASGDAAPIRTFSTSDYPKGIRVDAANNEVFVTEGYYTINVYPRAASGSAVPIRTIH